MQRPQSAMLLGITCHPKNHDSLLITKVRECFSRTEGISRLNKSFHSNPSFLGYSYRSHKKLNLENYERAGNWLKPCKRLRGNSIERLRQQFKVASKETLLIDETLMNAQPQQKIKRHCMRDKENYKQELMDKKYQKTNCKDNNGLS